MKEKSFEFREMLMEQGFIEDESSCVDKFENNNGWVIHFFDSPINEYCQILVVLDRADDSICVTKVPTSRKEGGELLDRMQIYESILR